MNVHKSQLSQLFTNHKWQLREGRAPARPGTEMVTNPDPTRDSYAIAVWGALKEYDWPDLVP